MKGAHGARFFLASLWMLTALALAAAAGCAGSEESRKPPDQRYGHRYEGRAGDGRRTLVVTPPDSAVRHFVYPAPIGEVIVRHAEPPEAADADTARVPVELLIKGTLPDACMSLSGATQQRRGHLVEVALQMRRPRGVVCEPVLRPYRFYLPLDGRYEAGPYTLKVNDVVYPFSLDIG